MTPIADRGSEGSESLDDQFATLSYSVRRRLLSCLVERRQLDFGEFVSRECTRANKTRESALIELHRHHLPALDAANFIDWEGSTDPVTRGPRFEEIEPLLETSGDDLDERT